MKAESFCRWLQGYFALSKPSHVDASTTQVIRDHLDLAFKYDIDRRYSEEQQKALNAIHSEPLKTESSAPLFAATKPNPPDEDSGFVAMC